MKKVKALLKWVMGISLAVAAISIAVEKPIEQFEQQRLQELETKRQEAEAARARKEQQRRVALQLAEARQLAKGEIEEAKRQKAERIAALDRELPAEELAKQKQQIEAEFDEQIAKIEMKARLSTAKEQLSQVQLVEDTTPRMQVKEIRFTGNTLIPTAKILSDMPVIFNSSTKPLAEAESGALYDFTPIFETILTPGTPREISARTIQGLTQFILSVYRQKNYAGIYVYVPQEALKGEKLTDDVLPVEIIEAKVTNLGVKQFDANQVEVSEGYLDPNAVLSWSPVKEGKVANSKKLDDFVNLLNLNPDRYVSAKVSKGSEPKTLAVEYDIYEVNPWHWFLQIDNSGPEGREWNPRIGVINTNLLGIDDTFIAVYQTEVDSGFEDNYALFGSYDFPLFSQKLRLNIYGGYSEFNVSSATGIDFLGAGKFIGTKLKYNLLQTNGWFLDVAGTFSHEESRINTSLFPEFLSSNVIMNLWGWEVAAHKKTDMSNSEFAVGEVRNLPALSSDDDEFARARPGGEIDNDFSIMTLKGSHSRLLDPDKVQRLSGTVKWIIADERLAPAKMTNFAGMYSVRGYEEFEVIADDGVLASVQYEFDIIKYEQSLSAEKEKKEPRRKSDFWTLKKLAPLAFLDYGRANIEKPVAGERRHQTLVSVGPGVLFELGDNFSGNIYYGIPLRDTDETHEDEGRVNVGLLLRW